MVAAGWRVFAGVGASGVAGAVLSAAAGKAGAATRLSRDAALPARQDLKGLAALALFLLNRLSIFSTYCQT